MSHHELINWAKALLNLFINSRSLKAAIKISPKMDFSPTRQLEMHPKSVNVKLTRTKGKMEGFIAFAPF